MPTTDQLLADQARTFEDWPAEIIKIGGINYPCLVMDQVRGTDWMRGGEQDDVNIRVAVERGRFQTVPNQGTLGTFRGKQFRIAAEDEDDTAASVTFSLEVKTKG